MGPEIWGPYFWACIHLAALAAPATFDSGTQAGYRQFYTSLQYVIPCKKCQEHLQANLAKLPIDNALVAGRDALFAWTVALHNLVNAATGKPEMELEKARELWTAIAAGSVSYIELDGRAGAGVGAHGRGSGAGMGVKKSTVVVAIVVAAVVGYWLGGCGLRTAGRRRS